MSYNYLLNGLQLKCKNKLSTHEHIFQMCIIILLSKKTIFVLGFFCVDDEGQYQAYFAIRKCFNRFQLVAVFRLMVSTPGEDILWKSLLPPLTTIQGVIRKQCTYSSVLFQHHSPLVISTSCLLVKITAMDLAPLS